MPRTHFYPSSAIGVLLLGGAAFEFFWVSWMVEHGVPFDHIATPMAPSRATLIVGRALLTVSALCFAVAAVVCFQTQTIAPGSRLISKIFDFSFALGFLSMGFWSIYRLALCLRYLRTTALPEERSAVLSAVFYWLGSGLFFPLFGLNQILWFLQRGSG